MRSQEQTFDAKHLVGAPGQAAAGSAKQSAHASRNNLNCTKLLEVMIECESLRDAEVPNDNFAGAICEAPVLIGKTLKCLPSEPQIHLSDLVNFRETSAKESITE